MTNGEAEDGSGSVEGGEVKSSIAFGVLVLLAVCLSASARADQLVMSNGDKLTGVILRADASTIVFKSEYAGELSIKSDAVRELVSDQVLHVTLKDGKVLAGKLMVREQKMDVNPVSAANISVERSSVSVIRSEGEQKAYEHSLHPNWLEFWKGYVDFGYSLTTGSVDNSTTTLGSVFARETRRDKTTLYAAYIKSKNDVAGITTTTANAIRGGGRYEYNLTKKVFAFGFADFEHNEVQLLDLRSVLGGGLGYSVIKSEKTDLQVFGGASYNHESYSTGVTRDAGELLVGQTLSHRLSNRLILNERFQLFPNLSEGGDYRMTIDAGVAAKVFSFLDWQLTVSDRYISNPVPGSQSNDLLLTTGLRFNLRR
jgi:putative salt-induced outer membrane protein